MPSEAAAVPFPPNEYNVPTRYQTQSEFEPQAGLVRGGAKAMWREAQCDLAFRNFEDLPESSAYWAPSTHDVAKHLNIVDLKPNSRVALDVDASQDAAFRAGLVPYPTNGNKLLVGSCSKADAGSSGGGGGVASTWYTMRVGPMLSTGGYDWWTHYWVDWGNLSELISRADNTMVGVNSVVAAPVDSTGAFLPLPPIHNHHVHITPGNAGDLRSETLFDCFLRGRRCLQGSVLYQQDGDYQCLERLGGTDCFGRRCSLRSGSNSVDF